MVSCLKLALVHTLLHSCSGQGDVKTARRIRREPRQAPPASLAVEIDTHGILTRAQETNRTTRQSKKCRELHKSMFDAGEETGLLTWKDAWLATVSTCNKFEKVKFSWSKEVNCTDWALIRFEGFRNDTNGTWASEYSPSTQFCKEMQFQFEQLWHQATHTINYPNRTVEDQVEGSEEESPKK
eukprot:gnl/TRDRNA2_/TRDRNA2_187180_c0_seq1.p1 gnl/TRDRNA2_/TRDRNA2_187180_c0~~gnl/TRDRNA2_/TRDRNA2_187180_c0_seq1.p1  ORF type:complete len:183 (+),score=27.69 gnl/TRDRNA2_/TRDRNA2_187180_c0_seq1:69-617(+)